MASSRSGPGWLSGGMPMSSLGIYGVDCGGGGGFGAAPPPAAAGRSVGETEVKNRDALKSHCEAERRRRERINGHLDTLRGLVPCKGKIDKATLLAEAIRHLKALKTQANEASKGLLIPTDSDQIQVEPLNDRADHDRESSAHGNSFVYIKASLCCEYKPELMDHLSQAIASLKLCMLKAEISTLGNRMKGIFVFSKEVDVNRAGRISLADEVYGMLRSVVDKIMVSDEYNPRRMRTRFESYGDGNKKQRVSLFEFEVSSSGVG